MMRCYWHPLAFISRHQLSPHGTAHNCAPHGSVAHGLTHVQENIFYLNFSCQQASCLKAMDSLPAASGYPLQYLTHHIHTGHCLGWFPSDASPEHGRPRPCLSLLWLIPVLASHGILTPSPQEHKQVPAVFIRTERCLILCSVFVSHVSLQLPLNKVHVFIEF